MPSAIGAERLRLSSGEGIDGACRLPMAIDRHERIKKTAGLRPAGFD
jgi:hypothetical protein